MFDSILFEAKLFLRDIAEIRQKAINKYYGRNVLKNDPRNKLFSKELNKKMGFTNMKTEFEYYDIFTISSNGVLNGHMDVID